MPPSEALLRPNEMTALAGTVRVPVLYFYCQTVFLKIELFRGGDWGEIS